MTYDEMKKFAIQHYNEGGDFFVECWDKKDYEEYCEECGAVTKKKALEMFRTWNKIYMDRTSY